MMTISLFYATCINRIRKARANVEN